MIEEIVNLCRMRMKTEGDDRLADCERLIKRWSKERQMAIIIREHARAGSRTHLLTISTQPAQYGIARDSVITRRRNDVIAGAIQSAATSLPLFAINLHGRVLRLRWFIRSQAYAGVSRDRDVPVARYSRILCERVTYACIYRQVHYTLLYNTLSVCVCVCVCRSVSQRCISATTFSSIFQTIN